MPAAPLNLYDLTREQLRVQLVRWDLNPVHVARLWNYLYIELAASLDAMPELPPKLRARLAAHPEHAALAALDDDLLRAALAGNTERYREAIAAKFPDGTRVSSPRGGFVLWVELPPGVDALTLHDGDREWPARALPALLAELAAHADALAAGDSQAAVAAVLDLDAAIVEWSADTLQSDEMDQARRSLRSMIVKLGTAATDGLRDPRRVLGPVVEAALAARRVAREEKAYAVSDAVRDGLDAAGIEVRDTADGVEWVIRS